jgi:alpha-glucosidase
LGESVSITPVASNVVNESFPSRHGVHSTAKNHYQGKRFKVTHPAKGISYILEMRVYDSGIAFRYDLTHPGSKRVTAESSGFTLPAGTRVWSQSGVDVYESTYSAADMADVADGTRWGRR